MKSVYLLFLMLLAGETIAQDPHRFDQEIAQFASIEKSENQEVTVFTGSSSIRFWNDLAEDCAPMTSINTGFGGSHMSDLLYFIDETVLRFHPEKVYIYEGDNDIAADKDPQIILQTAREVTSKIWETNPEAKIYFISAKPSPARWNFREAYKRFNALLKAYCQTHPQLVYIDVWEAMLDDKKRPAAHLFISDSLHMNRAGYILWKELICRFK